MSRSAPDHARTGTQATPKHTHTRYSDGTVSGDSHLPSSSTKCGYLWQ